MSRFTLSVSALVLAAGCLIVGVAHGDPGAEGDGAAECDGKRGHHGKRGRRGKHKGGKLLNPKHFERLADELKLDPQLRASLSAQLEAARAQRDTQRDAVHAEKKALRTLLEADAPDRAAVLAQIDRIGAQKTALKKLEISAMLDMKAALSPEQRAQLKAKMQARREKHRERRERRRGDKDDE